MAAVQHSVSDSGALWEPCVRARWEALYRQAGRTPLEQSWAYGDAVAAQHGQELERHVIAFGGQPVALLQAFRKSYWHVGVTRVLRGPVWLIDPLTDPRTGTVCSSIVRRYRDRRLAFLSWLPELPDNPGSIALIESLGLRRVVTGYASIWLDLGQEPEVLLAGLHGKWRAALRKAEREGVAVEHDGKERQRQASLLLYDSFRRKKRFVGPSAGFIGAVAAADKDALVSLSARRGGDLVAGVVLLRHGVSATYMASWTGAEGRAAQAHNLLLWRSIELLRSSGTRWLDLGGVNTESQPGLARFKLGLGGEVFTLAGSFL